MTERVSALRIHLERLATSLGRLFHNDILQVALVTLVPVDGIVTRTRYDNVLGVYVATVKLNTVVSDVVDLQVLDLVPLPTR